MTVQASDVPVGMELPLFQRHITREMAMIHGAPMKNFHTVLEEALAMGYPDLVIAGPMFICFFSEMFTRYFGTDWIESGDLEFKLLKPILANQTIAAQAIVRACEPEGDRVRVRMDIWCQREEDRVQTSVGSASVLVEP